ncbi:MAG TPA: T9SS type A sorting domain-containing protein, partial [Ignavibacteria bacterium]|nr:T9SS type A sorting domain-containing protein [Ignavibacteria bacterium]
WNNAFFFDISAGVFIGTNNTRVYKTVNLVNWTTQPTTGQVNSYAIWFNNALTGFTGGTALLTTTNGGVSWAAPSSLLPGTANISGITGSGSQYWVTRQSNVIYFTSNNGANWSTSYTAAAGNLYRYIARPRNFGFNTLYAVKSNGGITKGTIPLGITPVSNEIPEVYDLKQNYPNPFNPKTTIQIDIPKESFVKLSVYDEIGREVTALINENLRPGKYEIDFEGNRLSSGVYYYRLTTPDFNDTRKMILLK